MWFVLNLGLLIFTGSWSAPTQDWSYHHSIQSWSWVWGSSTCRWCKMTLILIHNIQLHLLLLFAVNLICIVEFMYIQDHYFNSSYSLKFRWALWYFYIPLYLSLYSFWALLIVQSQCTVFQFLWIFAYKKCWTYLKCMLIVSPND